MAHEFGLRVWMKHPSRSSRSVTHWLAPPYSICAVAWRGQVVHVCAHTRVFSTTMGRVIRCRSRRWCGWVLSTDRVTSAPR